MDILETDYTVVFMDFQGLSNNDFQNEATFSKGFVEQLLDVIKARTSLVNKMDEKVLSELEREFSDNDEVTLTFLFQHLRRLCQTAKKPVVLMIDEVDSATNNQVFLDFLAF